MALRLEARSCRTCAVLEACEHASKDFSYVED